MNVRTGDEDHGYVVTGVVDDFPVNSHFHPTCLASFSSLEKSAPQLKSWYSIGLYTYFVLARHSSPESVREELPRIVQRYLGKWGEAQNWSLKIQKLTNIHLHSHLLGEIEPNGSVATVLIFGAVGLFVLLTSIINFISLSTARFSDRSKEVGVRKVVGAERKQLVAQFIYEAVILTVIAGIIALSVVEFSLPYFNNLTGKAISLSLADLLFTMAAIILLGMAAGSYPAFFLSSFKTTSVLRKEPVLRPAGVPLRKGLIIVQFAAAIGIIASTMIAVEQLRYLQDKNLGFDKAQVLVIPLRQKVLQLNYPILRHAFSQVGGVKSVSGASGELGNANFISNMWYGKKPLFQTRFLAVDYGFLRTMGISLASGRRFSAEYPTDTSGSILVNEAAAEKLRTMGLFDKELSIGGVYEKAKTIGVLNNFNYRPLYYPVQPLVVFLQPTATRFMVVKLPSQNIGKTIRALKVEWQKVVPDYPFDWRFLDQDLNKQYHSDAVLSEVFEVGACLSIFISMLGLFGLTSYTVEKRAKEISIRRVLGASIVDVVTLLGKEYVFPVVIGNIIAWPVSFYFMNEWLQNFAYKVSLTVVPFLLAGGIALTISLVVVGLRTARTAMRNPVESLRYQ